MKTIFQQGDVVFKSTVLPNNLKELDTNVVQEGEHSGHAHRLFRFDHDGFETSGGYKLFYDDNLKVKFLKVEQEVEIRHEEHKAFKIPPGDYQITIVREFDHLKQMERQVID